jgi:hypothetical protein
VETENEFCIRILDMGLDVFSACFKKSSRIALRYLHDDASDPLEKCESFSKARNPTEKFG